MDVPAQATICRFEDFLLDLQARALFQLNDSAAPAPVSLGSRAVGILCVLIERRGELVPKHEIMNAVWPDVAVEDSNLTVQISALRRVLDVGRGSGSCIQTIAKRGYCFLPQVDRCVAYSKTGTTDNADPHAPDLAAALPHSEVAERGKVDLSDQIVPPRHWLRSSGWTVAPSLLVIISFAWLVWYTSRPSARTAESPRLSVVITPFENLSGNPADDYLADSITGEVTTDLSRVPNMFVIARTSAESYRGKSDDPIAIGQQLGVRYLVKGSVRKLEFDTSARKKLQWGPTRCMRALPSASRRPVATTFAPCATKTSAIRSPMPLVAPVTIATFPSSAPIIASWQFSGVYIRMGIWSTPIMLEASAGRNRQSQG